VNEIDEVEREEGRAQQRRLCHAVVPVGERAQSQQELAMQGVGQE
jgi:hypothetical protein